MVVFLGVFFAVGRRGAIATPTPPDTATLALVKLLPLPLVRGVGKYRGASVNPDILCFCRAGVAGRTAETVRVNSCISPGGRR